MTVASNSSIQPNLWDRCFTQDPDQIAQVAFLNLSDGERQQIGHLGIIFAREVDHRLWDRLDLPQFGTELTVGESLGVVQAALAMTLKAWRVLSSADRINLKEIPPKPLLQQLHCLIKFCTLNLFNLSITQKLLSGQIKASRHFPGRSKSSRNFAFLFSKTTT